MEPYTSTQPTRQWTEVTKRPSTAINPIKDSQKEDISVPRFHSNQWHSSVDAEEDINKDTKKKTQIPYFESYNLACKYFSVTPIKYIEDVIKEQKSSVMLPHFHLKPSDFKSLFVTLVHNYNILSLNLKDTNLKDHDIVEVLKICLLENAKITELDISNNHLDHGKTVRHIGDIIRHAKSITKLNLSSTQLRDRHVIYLRDGLVENNWLTHLNISHNAFSECGGTLFAEQIKRNKSLKVLDISWNHMRPKDASLILSSLGKNKGIIDLNISCGGLDDMVSRTLGKSLASNCTLISLNIAENRISNKGAKEISEGLSRNRRLLSLDISNNPITATGVQFILEAIIKNENLKIFYMRNISPDSLCIRAIEHLKRNRVNFQIEHGVPCATEVLPQGTDVYVLSEDIFGPIRSYLIKERLRSRDLFNIWDKQKTGELTYNEVVDGLNEIEVALTVDMVETLFKKLDTSGDGKISVNEFCAIIHHYHSNRSI